MSEEITGTKHDAEKLDWTLLTIDLIRQVICVVKVLAHGAGVHSARNWQNAPLDDQRRWRAAIDRHLAELSLGHWMDDGEDGTGQPHLACVVVNCLFIMWHHENSPEKA